MRCFQKVLLPLLVLFLLAGCKKVQLSGLDPCINEIEITITQGSDTQTLTGTATNGQTGEMELDDEIDPDNSLHAEMTVKSVKPTAACRERENEVKAENFRYDGAVPKINDELYRWDIADRGTRTRPSRPTDGGTVEGGTTLPPPRNRGDDDAGIVMWAENIPNCTHICWQQWAKTNLFIDKDDGNGFRETRNGVAWTDPAGHPQVFGMFGRDLPPGSTGSCFRLDPIPGKPGQNGIVDMPGHDITNATGTAIYRAGKAEVLAAGIPVVTGTKFSVRYDFDMYSVLVCDQPAPPRTIGHFHWQAKQLWEFTKTANGVDSKTIYDIPLKPQWTDGKTGLPAGVTAP